MAYGYSNQALEIFAGADIDDDPTKFSELVWELEILLECVTRGDPGQFVGPPENCWQGWAPEFEARSYKLTGESGKARIVIYDGKDHKVVEAIIGAEVLERATDKAIEAAIEEPVDDCRD